MKLSIQNKIATGLLIAAIASSAALFAQETKPEPKQKKSKVHISITTEENGKSKTIDTTFNGDDEEAMENFFRENGIESEMPAIPPIPPIPPLPPMTGDLGSLPIPPTPPTPPDFAFNDHAFEFSMNDSEMTELSKKMEEISEKMSAASEKMSKELEEKFGKDYDDKLKAYDDKMKVYEQKMKEYELKMENHYKEMEKKAPAKKSKTMKKTSGINDNDKSGKSLKQVILISPENKNENYSGYAYKIVLSDDADAGYACNLKTKGDVQCLPISSGSQVMILNDGNTGGSTKRIIRKIVIKETGEDINEALKNKDNIITEDIMPAPAAEQKTQNENYNSYALDAKDLRFSPNPNEGKFNLSFSVPSTGKLEVAVLSLSGQKVFDDVVENFTGQYNREIDISNHSKGTYLLQVRQGDAWLHKKFVVK